MLQPLCRVHKRMVFRPSEEAKFTNTKKERKLLDRKRIVGCRVQKTSLVYISFLEPTKCEGNRRRKPQRMLPNGLSEKKKRSAANDLFLPALSMHAVVEVDTNRHFPEKERDPFNDLRRET